MSNAERLKAFREVREDHVKDCRCAVCFLVAQLDALSELWRDAVACEARDCGCSARVAEEMGR